MNLPKNCYVRNDTVYYQKHVPKKLVAQVGKTTIKVPLSNKPTDEVALYAERFEVHEQVTSYLKSLESSDATDLVIAAQGLLVSKGLQEGELAPDMCTQSEEDYLDARTQQVLDGPLEQFDLHMKRRAQGMSSAATTEVEVQEVAFKMLKSPKFASKYVHTFAAAFNLYTKEKGLRESVMHEKGRLKSDAKAVLKRFETFLELNGNLQLTHDNIGNAQDAFKQTLVGNTPDSIRRRFTEVRAAFNLYIKAHRLDVKVPDLNLERHTAKTRKVLNAEEHFRCALHAMTGKPDVVKLLLLVMMQSSLHQSEIARSLSLDSSTLDSEVPFLRVGEGRLKTKYRERPFVPVFGVARLREMIDLLGPRMREMDERSLNKRLNNRIRKVTGNQELTSYSARHTWSSNAIDANVSSVVMNRLGGWSASSKEMSSHYGRDGDYTEKRLRSYQATQRMIFEDLISRLAAEGCDV